MCVQRCSLMLTQRLVELRAAYLQECPLFEQACLFCDIVCACGYCVCYGPVQRVEYKMDVTVCSSLFCGFCTSLWYLGVCYSLLQLVQPV